MTEPDQLALVHPPAPRRRRRTADPIVEDRPVARVVVDLPLAHLDRPFDYVVPVSMEGAVPGTRVSVRFAGQEVDGYVLERVAESSHEGRLDRLRRLVSPEAVLAPQIAGLARAVADRYAGTMADVLRLAVPPRHATVEGEAPRAALGERPAAPAPGGWAGYPAGLALLGALGSGGQPRVVWNPGPAANWADLMARLTLATLSANRGALTVLPDARDVARVDAALRGLAGSGHHVVLEAELGPAERYRRWLAVRRGAVRAVIGTRAAMFAPVADLGLVAVWDDGDDLHAEPRAPYPHVREVLLLRAHREATAAVVGGFVRTAEAEQLLVTGWATAMAPERLTVRESAPRARPTGDDHELARDPAARSARLPSLAWRAMRSALPRGPVLVQVQRAGYLPALVCDRCRTPARCAACHGPLQLSARTGPPGCGWCGRPAAAWACRVCGAGTFRAAARGTGRTAEELGRAFPGLPVRVSGAGGVLTNVPGEPALVVATPGAEPDASGGYAAAVLLDGDALMARPGLRAAEEALRRWLNAAAKVRPRSHGGAIVVVADGAALAVQALIRWDPAGFAARELDDRAALGFPPAARAVELSGAAADVAELLALVQLPAGAQQLGPVPDRTGERHQVLLRAPRPVANALTAAVKAAQGVRAARRSGGAVRVRVDPVDLG
ncbi:MAG: primosomal protein N' [Jiangellaceae bacterium]|nr:primosomal protein N' [Jiangellaceae bacterium]